MESSKTIIRRLLPAAAALALFFVVSAVYFAPQFRGEVLPQHDVVLGQHLAAELRGEVDCAHHEEEREGRRCRQQPAYDRFRRFHISSRYPVAGDRAGSGRKPRAVRIPPGRTLSE